MTKMNEEKLLEGLKKIIPLREGVRGYIISVEDSYTRQAAEKLVYYLTKYFPSLKFVVIRGATEILEV